MNVKKLIAHRGDNTNFPENSYAGFEAALQAGARFIELDIQMNSDSSLIVFHDDTFNRTCDKKGSVLKANDKDLLSVSAHQPLRFDDKHFPTRIPFLSEILALLKKHPKAHVFVEIKEESIDLWGVSKVMDKIFAALKGYKNQATIISFSQDAIKYTQQQSPLKTGLVFRHYDKKHEKIAHALKPDYMICAYRIIPEKALWKGSWQWMVYSINDASLLKKILARKEIDLIETDNIQTMLKAHF